MKRFIEGEDRSQVTLLPECLDDYIGQDNSVRVIDAFVEEFEFRDLGFEGAERAVTGRPCRRRPKTGPLLRVIGVNPQDRPGKERRYVFPSTLR